jgi:hypothetical protein
MLIRKTESGESRIEPDIDCNLDGLHGLLLNNNIHRSLVDIATPASKTMPSKCAEAYRSESVFPLAFVRAVSLKPFPEIRQKRIVFESLRFVNQPIRASWLR